MSNLLVTELTKPEYDGLTDAEALALLPKAEDVLGRIQGVDKLDLMTELLKSGSYDVWENFIEANSASTDADILQVVGLAKLLLKGLDPAIIMSEVFRINLAVADVKDMFETGHTTGLIADETYNRILELATYTVDEFGSFNLEDITLARSIGESDCTISYAGTLKGEQPHFVTAGKTSIKFEVVLAEPAPKDSVVTITYREKGEGETDFARVDKTFRQAILAGETKVNSRDYSVSTMNRHIDFSASIDIADAECSVNVVGK